MFRDLFHDNSISIKIDTENKTLSLSALLLATRQPVPREVFTYVEKRKDLTFKPHATAFRMKDLRHVELIQEVPYTPTIRREIVSFWHLVQKCRVMFTDLAKESL